MNVRIVLPHPWDGFHPHVPLRNLVFPPVVTLSSIRRHPARCLCIWQLYDFFDVEPFCRCFRRFFCAEEEWFHFLRHEVWHLLECEQVKLGCTVVLRSACGGSALGDFAWWVLGLVGFSGEKNLVRCCGWTSTGRERWTRSWFIKRKRRTSGILWVLRICCNLALKRIWSKCGMTMCCDDGFDVWNGVHFWVSDSAGWLSPSSFLRTVWSW